MKINAYHKKMQVYGFVQFICSNHSYLFTPEDQWYSLPFEVNRSEFEYID